MGSLGSGKTSSSSRALALAMLANDFAGLVVTVKPDERTMWEDYCRLTNRESDLVIIGPDSGQHFNFLEYESRPTRGTDSITENIVEVLKTVIQSSQEKSSGKQDDSFWEGALDQLLINAVDLCKLAFGKVSVENLYNLIQTIPKGSDEEQITEDPAKPKAFRKALDRAVENVNVKINEWYLGLPLSRQKELTEPEAFEEAFMEAVPDARLLKFVDQFFYDTFIPLASKTRSIIDFSVSGFLFRLLRDPVYSLFCRYDSTIVPEDCLKGKIILLDLPVKIFHKVGRDCQILFKYIFQRAMEKRIISENSRPLFLWADEAQTFIHQKDTDFQATARSSRIATVYITQNLPNYYSSMGGERAEYRVKSFLGTLGTKIFHANADVETNKYASELIGDAFFEDQSESITYAKNFSQTRGRSLKLERAVRPEEFVNLKTGGPSNSLIAECYFHRQGDALFDGRNHNKIKFSQTFKPNKL